MAAKWWGPEAHEDICRICNNKVLDFIVRRGCLVLVCMSVVLDQIWILTLGTLYLQKNRILKQSEFRPVRQVGLLA